MARRHAGPGQERREPSTTAGLGAGGRHNQAASPGQSFGGSQITLVASKATAEPVGKSDVCSRSGSPCLVKLCMDSRVVRSWDPWWVGGGMEGQEIYDVLVSCGDPDRPAIQLPGREEPVNRVVIRGRDTSEAS